MILKFFLVGAGKLNKLSFEQVETYSIVKSKANFFHTNYMSEKFNLIANHLHLPTILWKLYESIFYRFLFKVLL